MKENDKILQMFFQKERWHKALNKGSDKKINTAALRYLSSIKGREDMLAKIIAGQYHIERPYTAKIPKDTPGEFRTVFVNNGVDRIFLSILNDLLFDIAKDMIHPQCLSYQTGIGCSKIVTKASKMIDELSGDTHKVMGFKSDLSKYFDTVPIGFIDEAFDKIEAQFGKSLIIDIVREYYHNDKYYDSELKEEVEHYQSLKQGCAVASWLADVVLYHIDEQLSNLDGYYVRYSDDILYIGKDHLKAMDILKTELEKMQMRLNPKKVEYLTNDKWFKFLGFSIKGSSLSLSRNRIKGFAKEISFRTVREIRYGISYEKALHKVQSWLYYGDGEHSWATGVLKTINVKQDIDTLNNYVVDCLRAVKRHKSVGMDDIGGLGWDISQKIGCIKRGKGKKVRTLRDNTPKELDGYYTLGCMRNNLLFSRDLYDSIVREI